MGVDRITYDEERWPFVVVTFPAAQLRDHELVEHLARVGAYFSRGERFALVIDVRLAPAPDAAQRRMIAHGIDRAIERGGHQCIGIAIVVANRLQRSVVNTLLWLRRTRFECGSKSSVAEAVAWLQEVRRQQLVTAAGASRR